MIDNKRKHVDELTPKSDGMCIARSKFIKRNIVIRICFIIGLFLFPAVFTSAQNRSVKSPDGRLNLNVDVDKGILWSVTFDGKTVIKPSPIAITINGQVLGEKPNLLHVQSRSISNIIYPEIARKANSISNEYNELELNFKDKYTVIFHVYNDGIAYRFKTVIKGRVKVNNEKLELNFPEGTAALFPEEESTLSDNERPYIDNKLNRFENGKFCSLPMLATIEEKVRVLVTDADLLDYPNMFLSATGKDQLKAKFPPVVIEALPAERGADRMEKITKEADYIAETYGTRDFPWRVFTITNDDRKLAESDLVYKLSSPCVLKDIQWIKPGKASWDWWNANNIYNVDFAAGLNTQTYKYYIDFASKYGLEYIILDEGWSASTVNLNKAIPAINLHELVAYGKSKNVGIILWALWKPLNQNMDSLLRLYHDWGIKGIKVDFMQRSDQWMVNYYERLTKACAEHHLLVDFHGAFKPSGLQRMYPNIMSHEGVKGLEQDKWTHTITPEHDLTIPFIRMVAGPMDYTPGAMNNANRESFRDVFNNPMSMGTRCHQLAMYIVYESQLMMLADSPTKYYKESESTDFISRIPVVWDETHVLAAKVGDYIMTARRKGDIWYIGAMTDWTSRELVIDWSFLSEGNYTAEIMQDGVNAARNSNDYRKVITNISLNDKQIIKLAPGGGWVAIIKKK